MNKELKTSCRSCNHCLISKYASPKWISIVDEKKSQIWYRKGQYIFYAGNPVFGIYLITQGKIKIIAKGAGNKEQIVRLASNGHLLGRWGHKDDLYSNSAVALEDSQVCFINNALLKEMCSANPELTFHLMMYYANELRRAQERIKLLCQLTVKEKVAETLLYLIEVFGLDENHNIAVEMSRQEISELAGASPEQVSREITALKKGNIIISNGKRLVIPDVHKLSDMID